MNLHPGNWSGFRVFALIWSGQFVSMLGTGMTRFGLMVWAYQQTGEATTLALLGFTALSFLFGDFLFGVGRTLPVWLIAGSVAAVMIPYISAGNTTIWQSKVPPALQGRVFATRGMFHNGVKPLAYLAAGPIADRWLEPMFAPGAYLAQKAGWLVGMGAGAGIGLMFVGTAFCGALVCVAGYFIRPIRRVEVVLPDYDA